MIGNSCTYIIQSIASLDVLCVFANDDGELTFVIELGLGVCVNVHVVKGSDDGVWRFAEDYWIIWDVELSTGSDERVQSRGTLLAATHLES